MTLTDQRSPVIRRAEPSDDQILIMLLVAAFFHGDLASHLIPEVADRASRYFPYFEIIAAHALTAAHVDLIMDPDAAMPAAAAIWYPVGADGITDDIPDYGERLAAAVGPYLPAFAALDMAMHQHHPTGHDHDYLAFLAVHPVLQNRGLGSRLLEHHHAQLDPAGRPAYLEATGDRNRRLYERHGYTPLEPFPVADGGPPLRPMWRPGRPGKGQAARNDSAASSGASQ
ncbi:GNAT family N-acetyltransferase [Actinoplanes sp. NPDC026623]|uniref:GNAT family N-acetyltransferase n=1 Tax=Actinoplanes sp. NPDC026623 TaxID=3155610 RepID=UPI0033E05496